MCLVKNKYTFNVYLFFIKNFIMKNIKNNWFTLVELIVVITILVILWAIWFIWYSTYIWTVRDTSIITNMKEISKSLISFKTQNNKLSLPDSYISIKDWSDILWYQWYLSSSILESIWFEWNGLNKKINKYPTYYINKRKTQFQLLWFLEEEQKTTFDFIDNTYASTIDYTILFPYIEWKKLWVLTNIENQPVQENSTLIANKELNFTTTNANDSYKMFLSNDLSYTYSWSILGKIANTYTNPWLYWAPESCPDWFIPVTWDANFNQEWFCVAKYEMSYTEEDVPNWWVPNSNKNSWRNTYDYDDNNDWNLENWESWYNKRIASRNDYPIADITQPMALNACKTLWKDYHLITNNEWMTIARQIELNNENWSSWTIWEWYIYNWVSNDPTLWCDKKWWNNETQNNWTKTWEWSNDECDIKRKLKLSNWSEIYDFAWNVREHVNWSNKTNLDPSNIMDRQICNDSSNTFFSFWDNDWYNTCTYRSPYNQEKYWPLFSLNNTNGIWNIKSNSTISSKILIRWWYATNVEKTWIYTIFTSWWNNNLWSNTWFRCVKKID